MKGLLHPEATAHMPTVRSWLTNGQAALRVAAAKSARTGKQPEMSALIEENVLLQLAHLRTHPSVAAGEADGSLLVTGWVYDIARGTVRVFDEGEKKFVSYETLLERDSA